jgi:hypothetical protein
MLYIGEVLLPPIRLHALRYKEDSHFSCAASHIGVSNINRKASCDIHERSPFHFSFCVIDVFSHSASSAATRLEFDRAVRAFVNVYLRLAPSIHMRLVHSDRSAITERWYIRRLAAVHSTAADLQAKVG